MEDLFPKIKELFESRGKSFSEFCERMKVSGTHDIVLLHTFREFEDRLKNGELFADFRHFESLFYNRARTYQQEFPEIIQGYVPLIMQTFKPETKTVPPRGLFSRVFQTISRRK